MASRRAFKSLLRHLLCPRTEVSRANGSRQLVTSANTLNPPQYGGYLRTGQGTADSDEPRFLLTGASGQIGAELIPLLQKRHPGCVVASDVRMNRHHTGIGPFVYCDVQDKDNLARIILENGITAIIHLATLLSAIGEQNPQLALKVNTHGIQNVLELAAQHHLRVYAPSTIAVFGPTTPRVATPDSTIMQPTTMYGITKVHQELLGEYYHNKFGVDFRSLRYPGVISSASLPGGGTTDYAVEIFHAALTTGEYVCFLAPDTALPFLYMPDCLEATYTMLTTDASNLKQRTYNVTAVSFTPAELCEAIQAHVPGFRVEYRPDFRDGIARTWPQSIDDSAARRDWGWRPTYDLHGMTGHMLQALDAQLRAKKNRVATNKQKAAPLEPLLPAS